MKILPISWFSDYLSEKYLIFDKMRATIKDTYALSGFITFETPAIERVETLKAKWGDDNEIYGIHRLNGEKNDADLALRFDLTVPLARYIAQYEWELKFPFKRQHIDRSWRGERAQTGREREFYQADIDIIGREKLPLFADVEVINTIYKTLKKLNFWDFTIHINNKKILIGFLESIWIEKEKQREIVSVIDKKEKLKLAGKEIKVFFREILDNEKIIEKILDYIAISEKKKRSEIVDFLQNFWNSTLDEWLAELNFIYEKLLLFWVEEKNICFDNTISRGLNYYTGTIFETFLDEAPQYGSIASGGRYENLVGNFSKNTYPWVGGSIWLTRLFQVLESLDKFNEKISFSSVLILNFDEKYLEKYISITNILRKNNISTEIFLDNSVKIGKQFDYANAKNIHYALIIGENEIQNKTINIKNLFNGSQEEISENDLEKYFQKNT